MPLAWSKAEGKQEGGAHLFPPWRMFQQAPKWGCPKLPSGQCFIIRK